MSQVWVRVPQGLQGRTSKGKASPTENFGGLVPKYIEFEEQPTTMKTKIWMVVSKSSGYGLGLIRWYGPWRQYCFYPSDDTIFNKGCLDDIGKFMKDNHKTRNG